MVLLLSVFLYYQFIICVPGVVNLWVGVLCHMFMVFGFGERGVFCGLLWTMVFTGLYPLVCIGFLVCDVCHGVLPCVYRVRVFR